MIVVKLVGGLGNQMFQYSLAKYLSKKYDRDIYLDIGYFKRYSINNSPDERYYELKKLNIKENIYPTNNKVRYCLAILRRINNNPIRKFVLFFMEILFGIYFIAEPSFTSFRHEIYDLHKKIKKGRTIYLEGYFQHYRYYKDIKNELKEDFKSKSVLEGEVLEMFNNIKSKNSVAIHVRRTDYLKFSYPVVSKEYILKAMDLIKTKIKNPHFFVFLDDLNWCTENIIHDNLTSVNLSNENKIYDFDLMRNCNHFIISNSTYSYWASFLGENKEKIKIAPDKWYDDSRKFILSEDYIILK